MDGLLARGSEKWSKYPPDVLPAFVAEMDFALAPPIKDALHAAIERDDLGYIGRIDGLLDAFCRLHGPPARLDRGPCGRAR